MYYYIDIYIYIYKYIHNVEKECIIFRHTATKH
jgi:hypothetical protein